LPKSRTAGIKNLPGVLNIKYGLKEVMTVGTSSIAGGLIGGLISDKGKNKKKKVKEANYQFITNLTAPVVFCDLYKHLFDKLDADNQIKQLAEKTKLTKFISATVISFAGLLSGVPTGAAISNFINNNIIDKENPEKRTIKGKDILIMSDDIASGLAVTGALKGIPVLQHVDKVLPCLYLISGIETGNKE